MKYFRSTATDGGPLKDRPPHVCEACWNGVHRNHRPDLGGICIGCSCSVSPPGGAA